MLKQTCQLFQSKGADADWEFAQSELLEREGVDLKLEMEQKMREMEEQWRREKEEASQAFQQERKKYEDQIESLQKQVGLSCHLLPSGVSVLPNHSVFKFTRDIFCPY